MSEAKLSARSHQSKRRVKSTSMPKLLLFLIGVLCLIGMALVGFFTLSGLSSWLTILVLLVLLTIVISLGCTGHWLGVLIDDRNEMSLSRFQMVLWTLLILSAFLGMVMVNIHHNPWKAISSIDIPPSFLILMGISLTSLVSAPLILNIKQNLNHPIDTKLGSGKKASLIDMFLGDDRANGKQLDLGKLQMFYFTIILALAYTVLISDVFTNYEMGKITTLQFPPLNDQFLVLLGISHAGYLLYKAVPRNNAGTSSAPDPTSGTSSTPDPTSGT